MKINKLIEELTKLSTNHGEETVAIDHEQEVGWFNVEGVERVIDTETGRVLINLKTDM